MKSIYNKLIGNAYSVHLSTHQHKRMMKGNFTAAQKRNRFSFSFGKSYDETMMNR